MTLQFAKSLEPVHADHHRRIPRPRLRLAAVRDGVELEDVRFFFASEPGSFDLATFREWASSIGHRDSGMVAVVGG